MRKEIEMIKTIGILAALLFLYGLAGRADFETAAATAQERASCPPCPCEERAMPSPIHSPGPGSRKRFVENRSHSGFSQRLHRTSAVA
ncbi:MAG: hypothetical protein IPL03_00245 [Sterolibacteriaceae bacterium]|nr:hypothetical protein [Candidatus Methylophosphatis haderslevensis]